MEKLKQNLKVLGLTDEEIKIYFTALEQGSVSILQLARETKIPRTTVYLLIESLCQKGLLDLSVEGKKKRYFPASPDEIVTLGKARQAEISESLNAIEKELPKLQVYYNQKHQKPKIRYYEGIEEVKKIYEDSLKYPEIYVHCMSQNAIEVMGGYIEDYIVRLNRRMIHTKELVSNSKHDLKYQKDFESERNKIVTIPEEFITNTDYFIYGDSVAFLTYKDNVPVGVIISDPEIVHFEKIRFLMIWERFNNVGDAEIG